MTQNEKLAQMGKALMVVALDGRIRSFFFFFFPQALKQVEKAIEDDIGDFPDLMEAAKSYFEYKARMPELQDESLGAWTFHKGRSVPVRGDHARIQLSLAKAKLAKCEADGDEAWAANIRLDIEAMQDYIKHQLPPPLFEEKLREDENGELICFCGNRPDLEGFHPCNPDGQWCEPTPEEWHAACLVKCDRCGIVFSSLVETLGFVITKL